MATRFGAYEILYELKSGGMGAVLLGRRRGPGTFEQLVAIKTILSGFAQNELLRAMFLDEAALLARLSHPAIATVHDFGEDGGTLYMVMEYVAGIAFREVMAHGLPPTVAARAIAEACRGVHAAHELRDLAGHVLGVVHRDISPDNLMFGFDGHIKVIDFGIALVKNRQSPVTEIGTIKGKPPYMSPEQLKNQAIDRRSDVFSLAIVLWELLTGQGLFEGNSIYAIARAVEHQEILPPSQVLGAPLPLGLDAAVMNALDRDLARRTPSAAAFAEQLEQVIQVAGDETLEAWAARALEQPRVAHRAWLAGVVAGRDVPRAAGRATGAVTAVAPASGKEATMIMPIAPLAPAVPIASPSSPALPVSDPPIDLPIDPPAPPPVDPPRASLAADSDELAASERPRRNVGRQVALALLVLAMVVGIYGLRRAREAGRDPLRVVALDAPAVDVSSGVAIDAAVVAPITTPVDAPVDAAAELDAPAAPVDAGRRRTRVPLDAGRPPVDAAHTVARDAVPAQPAAQGTGRLIAKHKGERYLNVVLDGRILGPTPMFGQVISAGPHVVELVDAKTSAVVVSRAVDVAPGGTVSVVEP